jgi:tetratricopeptide (TPR) repeat protein
MSNKESAMNNSSASHWRIPLICLGLIALVFAIYGQTLGFGFVNLDDNLYVTANAHVLGGLSWANLKWAFVAGLGSQTEGTDYWMPLSLLSHMADVQCFGLWAGGHHLVNVVLFATCAVLLFLIFRSMTGALWKSAAVAAIWAVHPLRVESVAWISERKDLLGGLFFLLCVAAYLRFARKPSVRCYLLLVLLFILGLMSKPILVTLPVVLLLLDGWPLGRLSGSKEFLGRIWEKLPLFALSLMSCLMTLFTQKQAFDPNGQPPLLFRAAHAITSVTIYLGKTIWPVDLAAYYPIPSEGWTMVQVTLSLILLGSITALAIRVAKRFPYVTIGWFWYLVMVTPVSGIVQAGDQAYADRFTLLPQIGILMALVWMAADWAKENRRKRLLLGIGALLLVITLGITSHRQTSYWRDSISLMGRAISVTDLNALAHDNLGDAYRAAGRLDEALHEYQLSIAMKPASATTEYNLGTILAQQGLASEAEDHFQKALALNPRLAEAHNNFGDLLKQEGRLADAAGQIQMALEINPSLPEALSNLAGVMALQGRMDESLSYFRKARDLDPSIAEIHNILGTLLLQKGIQGEAIAEFEQAVALQPMNATYANNLAATLVTIGNPGLRDIPRAIRLAVKATELSGGDPAVLRTLAVAYARDRQSTKAITIAERAQRTAESKGKFDLANDLRNDIKGYRGTESPSAQK